MLHISTWLISSLSILAILIRPWKLPEWIWAVSGSALLILFRFISLTDATHAVGKGVDVYLFLLGMMLLSEQARVEGLFDWVAGMASLHAKGSAIRLFMLIYAAGILVTAFLSNDATAVVMTPAVYAAVKKANAKPIPYLFACAFIANAASFLLPISNPANLVVFSNHQLPNVFAWIKIFGLPSLASILATYCVLKLWFRKTLDMPLKARDEDSTPALESCGRLTAWGMLAVVLVMLSASALKIDLGLPTFLASLAIVVVIAIKKSEWPKRVFQEIAWGVVPLVAGLFVMVEALNQTGVLRATHLFFKSLATYPPLLGKLIAAFSVGVASNLANNLPVGLVAGMAVQDGVNDGIKHAVLLGVDLGPNLSVTGSLATLLWLMAIRREGESVSGFEFFKVGLIAMPFALIPAILVAFF